MHSPKYPGLKMRMHLGLFGLICLILFAGCSFSVLDSSGSKQALWQTSTEYTVSPAALKEPSDAVQSLVKHLTPRQKVGQLVLTSFEGTNRPEDLELFISEYQVGGLILYPRNILNEQQVSSLTSYGNSLTRTPGLVVRLPLIWCLVEEGGPLQRLPAGLGSFESASNLGAKQDVEEALHTGSEIGIAMQSLGLNTNLGPVFDRNAGGEIIGSRAFSSDPAQVAVMATAVMHGLNESKTISIIKHFPGIGEAVASPTSGFLMLNSDYTQLLSRELIPFQNAIDNGAQMVLVSHLMLPALDPVYPASLSSVIVHDLLREKMGFQGVILSDDLNAVALTSRYSPGEAAVQAILAGCDMVLVCHSREDQVQVLEALYQACVDGVISEERLNASVARIVALKQQYLLWP